MAMAFARAVRGLSGLRPGGIRVSGRVALYQHRGNSQETNTSGQTLDASSARGKGDLRPFVKRIRPQDQGGQVEADSNIDFLHPDYLQYIAGGLNPVHENLGPEEPEPKPTKHSAPKTQPPGGTWPYVKVGEQLFHTAFLRDACICPRCVDPSSKQKNIQTTDISPHINAKKVKTQPNGTVDIKWENDLPGFGEDHVSSFPKEFFSIHSTHANLQQERFELEKPQLWDKSLITNRLRYVHYEDYMAKDAAVYRALRQLYLDGVLLLRGVPESEKSVENIAARIGGLRDSFYGRTWDVKSVPQAKNVAYTAQYLGLHMDLLYMADPPGFQFLHCLKNTCDGGSSLFSDSFYAASRLPEEDFNILSNFQIPYHYRNAGEHYYHRHPVIEMKSDASDREAIAHVNYSPPFQATLAFPGDEQKTKFNQYITSLRKFAANLESEENLYEYRLQEGECVIFNNRRVLHGRRQFDTSAGERWLKGCYVDTDVFMSRYRVLSDKRLDGEFTRFKPRKANAKGSGSGQASE